MLSEDVHHEVISLVPAVVPDLLTHQAGANAGTRRETICCHKTTQNVRFAWILAPKLSIYKPTNDQNNFVFLMIPSHPVAPSGSQQRRPKATGYTPRARRFTCRDLSERRRPGRRLARLHGSLSTGLCPLLLAGADATPRGHAVGRARHKGPRFRRGGLP